MAGSIAALYYHIVFSTKERLPFLTPQIAPRVHEYLGGIIRSQGGISLGIGGMPDHVYVLASLNKNAAVSASIGDFKCNATGWIHDTFPDLQHFAWQEGYGAFFVSVSGLERVKAYIARQEMHHHTVTFQDEFVEFLRRHGIAYDERYIWK
ncbi:MAG TPA: transposase [Armatimonadota bacterium]|jgi:REP element-mobilizing transposase RayT